VEILFLADTNVFLEILQGQAKKESCKNFPFFFMSSLAENFSFS